MIRHRIARLGVTTPTRGILRLSRAANIRVPALAIPSWRPARGLLTKAMYEGPTEVSTAPPLLFIILPIHLRWAALSAILFYLFWPSFKITSQNIYIYIK